MSILFRYALSRLRPVCSETELRPIAGLVVSHLTGLSGVRLLTNETPLYASFISEMDVIVAELERRRPIQYILGKTLFCGLEFAVDEQVLIPRPETEELVAWVRKDSCAAKTVLDIGTGSGCIAVSLAKAMSHAKVAAFDVSETALGLARRNALANGAAISFHCVDIREQLDWPEKFNVIVSNPPYVTESEREGMEQNVLAYEPHLALFVTDSDPLVFYRLIAAFAQKQLTRGGVLYFEINRRFPSELVSLLREFGFSDVTLRKDQYGNDRMIKAVLA